MKANVCFITYSFDFDTTEEALTESVHLAAKLIEKMNSDFIQFSKSNDFDSKLIEEIYNSNKFIEKGALIAAFYDGGMSKARNISLDSKELISCINTNPSEHKNRWLSIYGAIPSEVGIIDRNKNIMTEMDLINHSKSIVLMNRYNSDEYALIFKSIYRNLIFHPNYNKINKITSGCENFINGIFEMFDVMNSYIPKEGDPKIDIDYLNTQMKFTTCEEGGAKIRRKNESNKLDFLFRAALQL